MGKHYESPLIEVMQVNVEIGFAISQVGEVGGNAPDFPLEPANMNDWK